MELKIDISNPEFHLQAAQQLIDFAGKEKIFVFEAPMGAGKTTFIKSICKLLGVTDTMSSPTYAIVNEYLTNKKSKIFHFDLYRLKTSQELLEIGFDEYIYSGNYVFIEWPELALPFLERHVKVTIELNKNIRYIYAQIK